MTIFNDLPYEDLSLIVEYLQPCGGLGLRENSIGLNGGTADTLEVEACVDFSSTERFLGLPLPFAT